MATTAATSPFSRLAHRWRASTLRYRICLNIQDAQRAWALYRGKLTQTQAFGLLHELEGITGSYALETLYESSVLDLAADRWGENTTELVELVQDACSRVAHKWNSTGDIPGAAIDWALDLVEEYAKARGIVLTEVPDESREYAP